MKPKKQKKQRPNVHTTFQLSDDACRALADALLFLLSLEGFSFEDAKISYDSASSAEDKLFDKDTTLTRGEVRATAKAIDIVLQEIPANASNYAYMETDNPNILADLEKDIPIFEELQSVFALVVKDLRKMK